jgi:hypothetical protein
VGDTLIGTTPMQYRAHEGDPPVEFLFHATGYADERVRALPSPALRITAQLRELPAAKPEPAKHRKRPSTRADSTPMDIKFER